MGGGKFPSPFHNTFMKVIGAIVMGLLFLLALAAICGVIALIPAWLVWFIWNKVIAPEFGWKHFHFWFVFFALWLIGIISAKFHSSK